MAARTPETNKELQDDCRKESPPAAIWPTTFCVAVDADAIGDENLEANELECRNENLNWR